MDARSGPAGQAHPIPDAVLARMEAAFGADFSDARVREDSGPGAVDAVALAQGSQIGFRPGAYDPQTPAGLQVIGHELAHVVQQRKGRVRGSGPTERRSGLTEDPVLDAEADAGGHRVAPAPSDYEAAPTLRRRTGQ